MNENADENPVQINSCDSHMQIRLRCQPFQVSRMPTLIAVENPE